MTPEQMIQRVKDQIAKDQTISVNTVADIRKFFDEYKNATSKSIQVLSLKEKIIGLTLQVLGDTGKASQKQKAAILELLERQIISSKYNSSLFNKLYALLENDDQNIAILASKAIDILIKQIYEKNTANTGATPLDPKQHYIKLFQFLKGRTQFLLKLQEHVKDDDFKNYRRQPYDETREKQKQKQKKQVIYKNTKSLKFINQVPHLFIHLMAYAQLDSKSPEDDKKIKELIRESIENIIQSLKKTPYETFYNEFNYEFNNELFAVMTKLLQFLFITLRNQKEDRSRQPNKSNLNLKNHILEQIQFIKVPEVIKNFIYLLKNCSEDFILNRYEIVNRLKLLLGSLDKNKLTRAEVMEILGELLNEDTIYGKKKILGDYSRNAICSYWVDIIKSPVLLTNIFYGNYLSIRAILQSGLSQDNQDISNCFLNIQKLLEEVVKTIFDNSMYPSVQQKCIELLTTFVDHLFPEASEHCDNIAGLNSSAAAKKVHENKLKILLKILQCTALKFESIKNIFEQIDYYLTMKLGRKPTKDDLPEPMKIKHMQLNSLDISIAENDNFKEQVVDYIQKYDENIDASLLTVISVPNKFLTIYEEDDELYFNSHPVKTTNFTHYMKEVKTRLIQKCIVLSHRLTKTFLTHNIESYTQAQIQSLKSIYFILSNKKALTQDQCAILSSILKYGLKIFEILHNYQLHSDDQNNKRGNLKNFMLIFAQVYDPVNFRNIFQPNMEQFFKNLVKYAKQCADYCLQYVLIDPFCSNNNRDQPFNKNIVQLLIYNLILRLQSTSDVLDPFHQFYGYKQEYFSLLQKLIRFPFRCLSRYADDSFIRNYFRQIILFLIKKAHTSRFCLDYLHLMRTLFKNILFNCNREAASPLFSQFYAICSKTSLNMNPSPNSHSIFVNVNVLQNFMKLYETGIPELADIVTELIIMLPLKSKHIIYFAKQGYIVKPLLHCLCLMSDYNYTLRTLKTFEIIISHSSAEQINSFLDGVKDKLINRLYYMVNECKIVDLKPEKINNDLSPLSLKLLAKLGCLSRGRQLPMDMKKKQSQENSQNKLKELELVFKEINSTKTFRISMMDTIEYAIQIFHKILDPYYQSIVFITMDMIEKCFAILKQVLSITLTTMHSLSERIISIFCSILSLSSKYLTISQSILSHIRNEVKNVIKAFTENVKNELTSFGVNEYCRFFIKSLITNLSERVLITREDNFIKQISQQPKRFIWNLIKTMLTAVENTTAHQALYEYVIRLLLSQVVMIKNSQHIQINGFQNQYNHVLPFKNAALSCLNQIIDTTPTNVLDKLKGDIIQSVFVVVATVPDILNLKIMEHPPIIINKIYDHILKDEKQFVRSLQTEVGEKIFANILQNLVTYSTEGHKMAIAFLNKIMDNTDINLVQLLYGGVKWEDIYDKTSEYTRFQSKYSLRDLTNSKDIPKCPLIPLAKNLVKISYNINDETLKTNQRVLKMVSNAFLTYQLLISLKYKNVTYHAFSILAKGDNVQFSESTAIFDKNFDNILKATKMIIDINSNIYGNYTKIIIEQSPVPQPPGIGSNNLSNPSRNARPQLNRLGPNPPNPPHPANSANQAFNINPNTFIDDEQYGLNVQDFDMEVRVWSELISSVIKFLKTVLINETIFSISKVLQKNRVENNHITQRRIRIIFMMFDLIGRVERSVRQTAYESIKELLSRQQHPKDLIQNDEKLKHILRPVLISLQLDFKKFTPSFLHMFRKILKLLTQCFNITLIQKLVDKLREMDKNKEQENPSMMTGPRLVNQGQQKYPNYSQITCEVKCIANFLGLFQHLAYAFHSHRSTSYAFNSLLLIFKYVVSISDYFIPKLGKHTVAIYIKKVLAKVLNTMCEKISGQTIFSDGQQRELDFNNFLEIIRMDDSYPLREKMTRQASYIEKTFSDFSKSSSRKDYLTFLEIVHVLAERNNKWLKNFNTFAEKILKQINYILVNRNKKFQEREYQQLGDRNQIVLLAKILLQYVKQNRQDIEALFGLVNLFRIRSTFDLHFIKFYLKYKLYNALNPETRRKIVVLYFKMYKDPAKDTDKILAISQNIIYQFILIEINMPPEERTILIEDEAIIKSLLETIKHILIPKTLHIDRKPYLYREAIQILQISNLAMTALKDLISDTDRSSMLFNVWGLLRIQDKIIKNYAFVWTSNYIRYFDGLGQGKALGLYLILIRALEGLSQGDYQIGALIKKALNILIPYWDSRPREQTTSNNNWIQMSLRAVHQQQNQPNKLVRFWEIVVKNHQIFNKFKEQLSEQRRIKFETQMVNSMQWLMVANNPTSTNPLIKKIASDMSFIYIQWKFKQVKEKIKGVTTSDEKIKILEETFNQRAAEICLNFFIKVALNNCNDKDDKQNKQIMKRSLYLLKKTLILWPNTKKKFNGIKAIVGKQKSTNSGSPENQSPLRFHYTLLNIINILLLYETDETLTTQLTQIFKLMELGHIPPPRFPTSAGSHAPQSSNGTIFTINNVYLIHLLCLIVKRLVKVALKNQGQESSRLIQQIHNCIKDGFDFYAIATSKSRNGQQPQQRPPVNKKIEIQVAISFLKIMFDLDPKTADHHLNNVKQVALAHKKIFEKGFESSNKNNSNTNRVYEPPALTQGTFSEMLEKDLQISIDLIKPDGLNLAEQNYEKEFIKSYITKRPLFVILLRILAAKINQIHYEERGNTIDIFLSVYEKIPDPELKIEVINIMKCLFIGSTAFPDNIIPERYRSIPVVDQEENRIFHLLFEDNNKFNSHFEKRKTKPSDPLYNLSQMLYQQITAKAYFDFLCIYILHLKQLSSTYLAKIRIFVLYALKVASFPLIQRIFNILDQRYYKNKSTLFLVLFEDYKELSCSEQYLQGDQIMLFFTIYLYKKARLRCTVQLQGFRKMNEEQSAEYQNYFLKLTKSDQPSQFHLNMVTNLLKTSFELLKCSQPNLEMIIKDYLKTGSYNDIWGSILLKIALHYDCLTEQEIFAFTSNITDWGTICKYCENSKKQFSKLVMDSVYRLYGDQDLISGYRMTITRSPELQLALCNLQQRKYLQSLKCINDFKNNQAKRQRPSDLHYDMMDEQLINSSSNELNYQKQLDSIFAQDVVKECYKNLNKWEQIIEKDKSDLDAKSNFLFRSGNNRSAIANNLLEIENNVNLFGSFYGRSVLHFLDPSTSTNRELNLAFIYSLAQWLCYPKNARCKQNQMLVKINCLLELEEGEKIKDQSNHPAHDHKECLDNLAKVVQSVYTQINYWRERMPNKNQDLSLWHSVLGQRNMLYENMKSKIVTLYDHVIETAPSTVNLTNFSRSDKLLVPYTDTQWNKLKIKKQERNFGIFIHESSRLQQNKIVNSQLFLDEAFIKQKERFYELFLSQKNYPQALKVLEDASICKDQELEKIQKQQILRLQAKVYHKVGMYGQANQLYHQATNICDQQLLSLWRDWMLMSIEAYEKLNEKQWAYSAISTLPYTLRHKTNKTKLLLAPIIQMLKKFRSDKVVKQILEYFLQNHYLPMKAIIFWAPQIIILAEQKSQISNCMMKVLDKLIFHSFSSIFFMIKPFLYKNSSTSRTQLAQEIIMNRMKDICYNAAAKLEKFSQLLSQIRNDQKISIMVLGQFCQCFTQIHLPLLDVEGISKVHPHIVQISENLETEYMNNKKGKIVTFLGSDGKQYQYRLETMDKSYPGREYETVLISQALENFNEYLKINQQSSSRGLKILEAKRILIKEDLALMKINKHSLSLLDVYNDYITKKTAFDPEYPQSDKSFLKIPKSELNKIANKQMKQNIPETVLRQYILDRSASYDEYIIFRKVFSYQYGAISSVNFIMGVESYLHNYIFELNTGTIYINEFKINHSPTNSLPFSVRLSRNIRNFITKVHINTNILPGMTAAIQAFASERLNMKSYLQLLFQELKTLDGAKEIKEVDVYNKICDLRNNHTKIRKILEIADALSFQDNIPYQLKYWF